MRVLIVDDDEQQATLLTKVISLNDTEMSVSLAGGGEAAIKILQNSRMDLVLTDLQMPGVSGLDLVQWLMENQPHVTVFAMTAYPDDAALTQLKELGTVECFTKPLDVHSLTKRFNHALSDGVRGQIRNISLPSLLQLVAMERKTCTLIVSATQSTGYLYMREGILVDAKFENNRGDTAAIEIISWHMPQITILSTCASPKVSVEKSVRFVIMESIRLQDERKRDEVAPDSLKCEKSHAPPSRHSLSSLSQFPSPPPSRAAAMAVIARKDGHILTSSGAFTGFPALAALLAQIFQLQAITARRLGEDTVEEVVLTTKRYWALCRPLKQIDHALAISVFDPTKATVVMERLELSELADAVREWSERMRLTS